MGKKGTNTKSQPSLKMNESWLSLHLPTVEWAPTLFTSRIDPCKANPSQGSFRYSLRWVGTHQADRIWGCPI